VEEQTRHPDAESDLVNDNDFKVSPLR
jgi:hypothetical protein